MAQLGHQTLGKLGELGVPSFVFINGLALGGGLEIALNADLPHGRLRRRRRSPLPEVFLGLILGWGGACLLPNLIGIENALKVDHLEPAQAEPDAEGAAGLRARHRGRDLPAGELPGGLAARGPTACSPARPR